MSKQAEAELDKLKPSTTNEAASKYFLQGLLLTKLGKLEDAVAANSNALVQNPNLLSAIYNIACIKALQGDKKAAISQLSKLEKLAKNQSTRTRYADLMSKDADLKSAVDEPGFKKLLRKLRGGRMKNDKKEGLFEKIAKENKGISVAEVAFIDKSFRENGPKNDPALGSFESLEGVSKIVTRINITKNPTHFHVSFGEASWDFSVSIDRKSGAWLAPVVGSVIDAPEPGPGPED
jgi:tetratricopeptide (TPR) repeat protein